MNTRLQLRKYAQQTGKFFGLGIVRPQLAPQKERYRFVFVLAFLLMLAVFVPLVVIDHGYFLYYGDYNSQQVIFYRYVHDAIRDGNVSWDWGTDLGTDFTGSYAFYILGSPFFWLTLPFPSGAVIYLMPVLLALKTAVAALTAYAYIRRFVKTPNAAVIGALLYAFSGFQAYNVFFNHFHDFTAFFPLVLLAFEQRIQDNRRGAFALAIALCAVINYFFLSGIVTFLVIYFFVRVPCRDFKITLRKFISLMIEAVIGVALAGFILLPAYYGVISNTRLGGILYGEDMVMYSDKTRILRIIQSFFMLPDPPARVNLFPSDLGRWASIAGYLPLFSMAGVIAFIREKGGHWAKHIIIVCMVAAFIPILNTSFYLFNSSYYARWYFMPILIMAMMTAYAIDNRAVSLKKGVPAVTLFTLGFLLISRLPSKDGDAVVYGKIAQYPELFYIQIGVSLLMLVGLIVLIYVLSRRRNFLRIAVTMTSAAVFLCMGATVWYGFGEGYGNFAPFTADYSAHEKFIDRVIDGDDNITLPEDGTDEFFRVDSSDATDNWPMLWGYSTMRSFQSVVNGSIMEFYQNLGLERDVATRIDTSYYALRGVLSVKYYFNQKKDDQIGASVIPITGFSYYDSQNGFDIYKNDNYVPMGFAYEYYMTEDDLKNYSTMQKTNVLADALILTDEQASKYTGYISDYTNMFTASATSYTAACDKRRSMSCSSFVKDTNGFTATISLANQRLVFFSVPYDAGWSAQVNGKTVDVENVSGGLMAVAVPKGESTIVFSYHTQGRTSGLTLTFAGIFALLVYLAAANRVFPAAKEPFTGPQYDYDSRFDENGFLVRTHVAASDEQTDAQPPQPTDERSEDDAP
ncbi:MAG: YfhO family protein [Oscillospiraceae bacterium]